ncbi:MAG TPA: CRTAC1 family protein [Candidatus Limnocylindria bacterium]
MPRSRRLLVGGGVLAVVAAGVLALLLRPTPGGGSAAGGASTAPTFVEEAEAAGIQHAYSGDFAFFVGGGVAAFDCNDDGRQDLYLAGGAGAAALYRNESPIGGALRFARIPHASTDLDRVTGAYPLDFDGDGRPDLAVLRVGENVILRGVGDCRFERANEAWAFDGGDAWSAAFSATWEGDATLPTLAIGNYLELNPDDSPTFECLDNQLFQPAADGSGYGSPLTLAPGYCPLSMLFSDWDRSGRRDLRVSNDRHYYRETSDGEEQLWRIAPGEPPRLYGREDGWQTVKVWGMGIASHDLTGDGYPEIFLTSQGDNKLQTLANGADEPRYSDIALRHGVTAHRPFAGDDTTMPSTAWHAEFQDLNNDGLVDLFISKGNVDAQVGFAERDPSNLLIQQPDGTFAEAAETAGILTFAKGRGAALADLNLDGLLDLVMVTRNENIKLWRNVGGGDASAPEPMGSWIGLRLKQAGRNRDAIGAWVEVTADGRSNIRELTVGGGHVSGALGWTHFGLGGADEASVTVTWPDGTVQGPMTVQANGFAVITRDAPDAETWSPR